MQDEWMQLDEYPGYSISVSGLVRNDMTDRILKRTILQNGAPVVGVRADGRQYLRQVSTLMAMTWLEPSPYKNFTTPTHLDGDRSNCHMDNLVLRPRWFAIQYHKECHEPKFPNWNGPFRILEMNEVFDNPWECSRAYGFLQGDIMLAVLNDKLLFPGALTVKLI